MAHDPTYTVTQICQKIKTTIESTYGRVRVEGEIFQITVSQQGHTYLTLKEGNASLKACAWKWTVLSCKLTVGMHIICEGKLTTYLQQSNYQMIIQSVVDKGQGTLHADIKRLYQKLKADGVFDKPKRPFPMLPMSVGFITSKTGAVLHDMLNVMRSRCPCHIKLYSVNVQGDKSVKDILGALTYFNSLEKRPDVLILARGGGSLEDLHAFYDEQVVLAVASSKTPIISAIGHETDMTLTDLAADKRCPTPTAAATACFPDRKALLCDIDAIKSSLNQCINSRKEAYNKHLSDLSTQLHLHIKLYLKRRRDMLNVINMHLSPAFLQQKFTRHKDQLMALEQSLKASIKNYVHSKHKQLEHAQTALKTCSHQRTLSRGFCMVTDHSKQIISSAQQALLETYIQIHFQDGSIKAIPQK